MVVISPNFGLEHQSQEFERLYAKNNVVDPQAPIIQEWRHIWREYLPLVSDEIFVVVRKLSGLHQSLTDFFSQHQRYFHEDIIQWENSFLDSIKNTYNLFYGLFLVHKYTEKAEKQEEFFCILRDGMLLISESVIGFLNDSGPDAAIGINTFEKLCRDIISGDLDSNTKYLDEGEEKRSNILIREIKNIAKAILLDIQSIQEKLRVQALYFDFETYKYMEGQSKLFDKSLPDLMERYSGLYVYFDDGNVIDSDRDEDALLDRVLERDVLNSQGIEAVFVEKVPEKV